MKLVDFQGDQIQTPMKMKIMSEKGGKEVRHGHKYCVKHGAIPLLFFIFNLVNSALDIDRGNFLSGIPAIHICIHLSFMLCFHIYSPWSFPTTYMYQVDTFERTLKCTHTLFFTCSTATLTCCLYPVYPNVGFLLSCSSVKP